MIHGVEIVNVGVEYIERVGVPQRTHELALSFLHCLAIETVGQPRSAVGIEIPPDRVRAVSAQRLHGAYGISLRLTHLFPVLIQYQAHDDHVLVSRTVEQQGRLRMEGIEPSSGLIHSLRNKCRGIPFFKQFLVFKRIMQLGIGHCAGIKPAVDHFRHTLHGFAAVRAGNLIGVDIRAVKLHIQRILPAGKFLQFLAAPHGNLLSAALTFPDVQRSSPVTVSGNAPVLNVLQPVSETAFADVLRDPVDLLIILHQVIFNRSHLDEPGFSRIIKQRRITAPAMGVIMLKFRRGE